MTLGTLSKLHKHYSKLASGNFNERDFDFNFGNGGSSAMGELSEERIALIKSDAQRHLKDLETKYPALKEKPSKNKKN